VGPSNPVTEELTLDTDNFIDELTLCVFDIGDTTAAAAVDDNDDDAGDVGCKADAGDKTSLADEVPVLTPSASLPPPAAAAAVALVL